MSPPTPIDLPTKNQINKAGKYLRDLDERKDHDPDETRRMFQVVQAFRDAHAYPMLKVRIGLDSFVKTCHAEGGVTQRHKRVPRIVRKLQRMKRISGGTGLARLEDIGGCRAVLATPSDLYRVRDHLLSRWGDQLTRPPRDYIDDPKFMGYRAVHVVVERDERAIEVQLRTQGQQDWAEAVERADAAFGCNLKDEDGPEDLVQYFKTSGEVIHKREFGLDLSAGLWTEFDAARARVIRAGYYTE